MAEIRIEHLQKAFGDFTAVRDSTFTVRNGEFFCLLGPSGCGKTTTLRMIAGLELPTSGRILLGDEDVTFKRASQRDIAFVFQLFALYPHMNVRANMAYPLRSQGMLRKDAQTRVEEAARILRIEHLLDRPVSGLSSGDRQRVALGRALVRRTAVGLLDEPLGHLDAPLRLKLRRELPLLRSRFPATMIIVTHDPAEALALGDRVAVIQEGKVLQVDRPENIRMRPCNGFVTTLRAPLASVCGAASTCAARCGTVPAGDGSRMMSSAKQRGCGNDGPIPDLHSHRECAGRTAL